MTDDSTRELARDPQDLERLLIRRQHAGDLDGMVALYERDAVLDCGDGTVLVGQSEIRSYYADQLAMGRRYAFGEQRPALIRGELALTSTLLPDGSVTAEVARRQSDGTWLWVIDRFSIGSRVR